MNARQPDGATALHWAVYLNDLETVDLLIAAGAAPDVTNELGVAPLYLACENGNAALARKLLAAGATPHAMLPSGETALMTAARAGSAGAVRALLAHGADVQAREAMEEQTALMWAASQRHAGVVDALLGAGADVHARSRLRPVVQAHSARTSRDGAVVVVEEGGFTPLLFAARSGDLASAELLLAAGADPNDTAPAGTSALVVAAHSGHGALAATLLAAGADPNAAGAGYTPLHAAILRGDEALVAVLLAHGADPNARLLRGTRYARQGKLFALDVAWTGAAPFFLAAKFGRGDIMRRLAESGADPHAGLDGGVTPLMAAAGMLTGGFGRAGKDRLGREMDSAEMEVALTQDPDRRGVMNSGIDAVKGGGAGRRRQRRQRHRRHRAAHGRLPRLQDRGAVSRASWGQAGRHQPSRRDAARPGACRTCPGAPDPQPDRLQRHQHGGPAAVPRRDRLAPAARAVQVRLASASIETTGERWRAGRARPSRCHGSAP